MTRANLEIYVFYETSYHTYVIIINESKEVDVYEQNRFAHAH